MSDDEAVWRVMARCLAEENPTLRRGRVALADLADQVAALPPAALSDVGADVLVCWALLGVTPPAALLDRMGALDIADGANAWATRALLASWRSAAIDAPPELPADREWDALADNYARTAVAALPGRPAPAVADRAEDLLRGVGHALLSDDLARAGRLLRWLALAPTAVDRDAADALAMALERTRGAPTQAFHVLVAYRLWRARASKTLGTGAIRRHDVAPTPEHAGQAALVAPAVQWFMQHRDEFVAGDRSLPALRKLGELAICGDQLLRNGAARAQPAWQAAGRTLLEQAWDELGRGALLAELVEAQPAMSILVTHYPPFFRHGLRNERLEQALARHAHAIPRPIAYLAAHALNEVQLASPWSVDEAYAWTVVGAARPPWRLTPIEVYVVTHIAFYESSFGDRRRPFAGRDYLARWVPVWLRHAEKTGALDLLAEMIFAWHCFEAVCCPPRAWQALITAQEPDGSVPFSRHARGDRYHSTLMALVASLNCRHW